MSGTHHNAFVAVRRRPSCRSQQAMGFCFFDNAAIAARHAQRKYGIGRAAVVDFRRPSRQRHPGYFLGRQKRDVLLDASDAVVSRHRCLRERGEHDTIVNAPLASEDGSVKFRAAFET